MRWLQDPVFSIREAATGALEKLSEQFGSDWARDHLVPDVLSSLEHENYLYRVTALNAVASLAPHVRRNVLDGKLLPAVTAIALKDKVPNVRFNSAKVLERLAPFVDGPVLEGKVKPVLKTMAGDPDTDVRFFAAKALAACDQATFMR